MRLPFFPVSIDLHYLSKVPFYQIFQNNNINIPEDSILEPSHRCHSQTDIERYHIEAL